MLLRFLTLSLLALGFGGLAPAPPAPPVPLPAAFRRALAAGHLTFTAPAGLLPVPVLTNEQMSYDYALKSPKQRLEIRYAIRPITAQMRREYQAAKGQKNEVLTDPNGLYSVQLQVIAANVSGGEMPEINEFPPAAVRQEFQADWGGTVLVTPKSQFAGGYRHCMIVALHKQNAADAYYFYLFNDQATLDPLLNSPGPTTGPFHALRFRL